MADNSERIVIAGGTGFIGRALSRELVAGGYEVVVLTRGAPGVSDSVRYVNWDGRTLGDWAKHVDGARAVVNLAGKNVNCRYTPRARDEINQSRMLAVRVMHEAVA